MDWASTSRECGTIAANRSTSPRTTANISVPLMLSSKGYGIFWNNTSRSRFNNRFANYLYISSEVADVIDYYFLYGPEFDKIIAGYRELTGQAPMFGKWAYGFWQCKNRYKSQDEILGVAKKYRELHIPVDNIVQDWFWWNRKGEFVFNKNYPDPKAMIDQLHARKFPSDDFDLALLRARIYELRLHGEERLVCRQIQIREAAVSHRAAWRYTTRRIRSSKVLLGSSESRDCSASAPTPGGWIRPNRKPKDRKKTFCWITSWPRAAETVM